MDIAVRNSDQVVLFAEVGLTQDQNGLHGNGWNYPAGIPGVFTLYFGVNLPDGFVRGQWTFDGSVWAQLPQPPSPPYVNPQAADAVAGTYLSSLRRKAAALQKKGDIAGATALYLQAAGVPTK